MMINAMKKLTKKERILADVDDEISLLYERIKLKHDLNWAKSRDAVNAAIRSLYMFQE